MTTGYDNKSLQMPMSELRCIAEFKSASTLVRVKQGCDETRIELDSVAELDRT